MRLRYNLGDVVAGLVGRVHVGGPVDVSSQVYYVDVAGCEDTLLLEGELEDCVAGLVAQRNRPLRRL